MKIWQRYLFSLILRTFCFFLISVFALYILIDCAIHGSEKLFMNYFWQFFRFLPLFLSLSFLLALLKIFFDLHVHNEIMALQIGGLSIRKIFLPFFLFASFLSALCYANSEWLLPKVDLGERIPLSYLQLQDGSELVYCSYNESKKEFADVFWIRSFEEIWHFSALNHEKSPPQAKGAEHFIRKGNFFEKEESASSCLLSDLSLNTPFEKPLPVEFRSLSSLFKQIKEAKQAALFHYKLALPLTSLLIVLWVAPITFKIPRGKSFFLLIAGSLFSFALWMMFLESMVILAENQIFSATALIWGPFFILLGISSYSFFSRIQ